MPIQDSVRNFHIVRQNSDLVRELAAHVGIPYRPSMEYGEIGSWKRSLPALFDLLSRARLDHVQVLLEFRLPYSPKRVDVVLCGIHPDTGLPSYVLVELKQWSAAKTVGTGLVRTDFPRGQPELHPAEQVRRYCRQLIDFTPLLARRPDLVRGLAYMHEAERTEGWDLDNFEFDDFGQLYTKDLTGDLLSDLWALLETDPSSDAACKEAAEQLVSAVHGPARTLLKTAADSLAQRDDFVLLDEQQVAFQLVRDALDEADRNDGRSKRVIVVRGGPGSGKSAIAITLLNSLARRGKRALHATGSRAFTETLRQEVARGDGRVDQIFRYFNEFGRAGKNDLDVLICDEAHRVRGNANVPPKWRDRLRGQIDELIDAAKVPVFLLDEHQVVRPGEIGTTTDIVDVARAKGCQVLEVHLGGQFRCGGSDYFDEWVRRLLGLDEGDPVIWSSLVNGSDDQYVVDSAETPGALEAWLRRQSNNFGGTARIAAGFCWDWSDPVKRDGDYRLVEDIVIGGWRRPWNANRGVQVPGVPSASLWASDPAGFGQVGCIYTAQGFEYDWAGTIFGDDLVIRDGRWQAHVEQTRDKALKTAKPAVFDRLVRNTYKVLLTRGMQGVCVYSKDGETNDFLRKYAR